MSDKFEVYKSIAAITGDLAKEGISKDRKNQQQGFQYRGIDDVYAALSSLLATHKLCILPRIVHRDSEERTSAKGGVLFYNAVTAEFDLVSAIDGSKHTVIAYGEAFDSGDKSIGKAMSYAYKAMAFMTFCIPTEGEDNDPDAQCHEVKPQQKQQPRQQQAKQPQLSEAQTKYFPRVKAALDTLHGSDIAAKKATIKANTALPAKGTYPARDGIEDYRTLDGDRLKYFCNAVEKLAEKNAAMCNECRQVGSHADSCPNAEPPVEKMFEEHKNQRLNELKKDMQHNG